MLNPRKRFLAGLGAVVAIAAIGIAVAYFTSTGGGTGAAAVGTSTALVIHGSSASTLYPGTTSAISFTVDNPGTGHEYLTTVHLGSVKACLGTNSTWNGTACTNGGTDETGCESVETGSSDSNTGDFWMPDVTEDQDIAGGASGTAVTNGATLEMNDLSSNQDACKNVNLTLNFTST